MKTDKNTWKGFFFFLLRLFAIVAVIVCLFFAYEYYRALKVDSTLNAVYDVLKDYQMSHEF